MNCNITNIICFYYKLNTDDALKRPRLLYLLFISLCRVIQRPPDLGGGLTEGKQLLQLIPALSQPVPSATCSATGCDYSKERETETKKKNRFVVECFVPASLKLPAPESCGLPEHCSPASTLTSSARGLEQVKGDFSSGEVAFNTVLSTGDKRHKLSCAIYRYMRHLFQSFSLNSQDKHKCMFSTVQKYTQIYMCLTLHFSLWRKITINNGKKRVS